MRSLIAPAVAKWHFVEEKARSVLDSFCHREARPAAPDADALVALTRTYVAHAPWERALQTRWYALIAGPDSRQLAAVSFGSAAASAEAEMCLLALTLLRDCGLDGPAAPLRLAVGGGLDLSALLRELGEEHELAPAALLGHADARADGRFEIAVTRPAPGATAALLCRGGRNDRMVQDLGGPPTPAAGLLVDLDALVGALPGADEGYQPAVSVVVAPTSPAASGAALGLAQRLRQSAIRTLLEHRPASAQEALAGAAVHGARCAVLVDADGALLLTDLGKGGSEALAADDLVVRIAQLLD